MVRVSVLNPDPSPFMSLLDSNSTLRHKVDEPHELSYMGRAQDDDETMSVLSSHASTYSSGSMARRHCPVATMEQIVTDRRNKAHNGGTLGSAKRMNGMNQLLSRGRFVLPLKRDNNNSNDIIQRPHKRARVDDKENVCNGSGSSITAALTDTICTAPTTHRYAAESDDEDSFTATHTTSTTPIVRHGYIVAVTTIQSCIRRLIVRQRYINSLVAVTTIQSCIWRIIVRHRLASITASIHMSIERRHFIIAQSASTLIQASVRMSIERRNFATMTVAPTDDMMIREDEEEYDHGRSESTTVRHSIQLERLHNNERQMLNGDYEDDSENEFVWNGDNEQHDEVSSTVYDHVSDLFCHLYALSQLRVIIPRWWMIFH